MLISPLVGRETQLAVLESHLARVRAGRGGVIFLTGEAGIGKTRLVRVFADALAHDPSVAVLAGQCYDNDQATPYAPFIDLLRGHLRQVGKQAMMRAAGVWRDSLLCLLPELGAATTPPLMQQRQLFDGVANVLRPPNATTCHVVVLEDLHWADQDSLALLAHVARELAHDRVLLLGTYRSDEQHAASVASLTLRLKRDCRLTEMVLPPLTATQFAQFAQALLPWTCPPEWLAQLYAHTGGHPLFAEEVLAAVAACNQINLPHNGTSALPVASLLPPSLRAYITQRIADLDTVTATVLAMAAVIGSSIPFTLLTRAVDLPATVVAEAVATLVQRHLLVEDTSSVPNGGCYQFRHALVRDVCYTQMLACERQIKHRAVLAALEQLFADNPAAVVEQFAYHSRWGEAHDQLARYARQAGDQAMRRYAYRDAIAQYEVALTALSSLALPHRAELHAAIGHAAYPLGRFEQCHRAWHAAQELYIQIGNTAQAAELGCELARVAWEQQEQDAAFDHAHSALALLAAHPPCPELAQVYSTLAHLCTLAQRHAESITWAEQALALANELDLEHTAIHALNSLGVARCNRAAVAAGIGDLEQSLQRAIKAEQTDDVFRAYNNLALYLSNIGQLTRAAHLTAEGLVYTAQVGWEGRHNRLRSLLAWITLLLGQWSQTRQHLAHIWQAQERDGSVSPILANIASITQGHLLMRQGQPVAAQRVLADMLQAAPSWQHDAGIFWLQVEIALAQDDIDQAVALADAGFQHAWACPLTRAQMIWCGRKFLPCIDAYLVINQFDRANTLMKLLAEHHQKLQTPLSQAVLAVAQGRVAATTAPTDAAAFFQQAITLWQSMGTPWEEARSRRQRAACLLTSDLPLLREEAARELQAATAIATYLGAEREQTAIAALEQQHGLQRATAPTPREQLTKREHAVLHLLAQGLSNRELASALGIAEKTAETHVRNILSKLHCASRTQAVAYALQHGVLSMPIV